MILKTFHFVTVLKCFEMFKKHKSFLEKIRGARLYIPVKNEVLSINDILVFDGYFLRRPIKYI